MADKKISEFTNVAYTDLLDVSEFLVDTGSDYNALTLAALKAWLIANGLGSGAGGAEGGSAQIVYTSLYAGDLGDILVNEANVTRIIVDSNVSLVTTNVTDVNGVASVLVPSTVTLEILPTYKLALNNVNLYILGDFLCGRHQAFTYNGTGTVHFDFVAPTYGYHLVSKIERAYPEWWGVLSGHQYAEDVYTLQDNTATFQLAVNAMPKPIYATDTLEASLLVGGTLSLLPDYYLFGSAVIIDRPLTITGDEYRHTTCATSSSTEAIFYIQCKEPVTLRHLSCRVAEGLSGTYVDPTVARVIDRYTAIPVNDLGGMWTWTKSASTSEYYLRAGSTNPQLVPPWKMAYLGSDLSRASVGSLSAGQWGWGNVDTLGYNTIYVRLSDSTDPDGKAAGSLTAVMPFTLSSRRNGTHTWAASSGGTSEYYIESTVGQPYVVTASNIPLSRGNVGSLSAGQWGWGDNDSLGADTLYIRLSDSADPDGKAADFVKAFDPISLIRIGGQSVNNTQCDCERANVINCQIENGAVVLSGGTDNHATQGVGISIEAANTVNMDRVILFDHLIGILIDNTVNVDKGGTALTKLLLKTWNVSQYHTHVYQRGSGGLRIENCKMLTCDHGYHGEIKGTTSILMFVGNSVDGINTGGVGFHVDLVGSGTMHSVAVVGNNFDWYAKAILLDSQIVGSPLWTASIVGNTIYANSDDSALKVARAKGITIAGNSFYGPATTGYSSAYAIELGNNTDVSSISVGSNAIYNYPAGQELKDPGGKAAVTLSASSYTFTPAVDSTSAFSMKRKSDAESFIHLNSTSMRIGVRNATPQYAIDLGALVGAGALRLAGASQLLFGGTDNGGAVVSMAYNSGTGYLDITGTPKISAGIQVNGTTDINGSVDIRPASDSTTAVTVNRGSDASPIMTVNSTNLRVGIRTATPQYAFDVGSSGGIRLTGTNPIYFGGTATAQDAAGGFYYDGSSAILCSLPLKVDTTKRVACGGGSTGVNTAPAGTVTLEINGTTYYLLRANSA